MDVDHFGEDDIIKKEVRTMPDKNLTKIIVDLIHTLPGDEPIFTEDLVKHLYDHENVNTKQVKPAVNTILSRQVGHTLQRFDRGVFYKPKQSVFGIVPLNPDKVLEKRFIREGSEIFGYETGPSLYEKLGLTTQMPRYRHIASNRIKKKIINNRLRAVVERPKVTITDQNYLYLQVLDALILEGKTYKTIPDFNKVIFQFIKRNKLDFGTLLGYGRKYYPKKVVDKISQLAELIIN
jgi:hypothetical protein